MPFPIRTGAKEADGKNAVLIQCAGLITIASREEQIWKVNVDGTRNIVDLCIMHHISKLIYVSSVLSDRKIIQAGI